MAEVVPYTSLFANQSAIVTSNDILSTVETSNNRIAEVNTNTYVLQTACNAAISDKLGIPAWLADAISNSIVEGEVDIRQIITDLDTALRSLVTGVSQQISSVQTEVESNNTLLTGVVSRLDDDIAGVITLANSKVTPDQASALMSTFLAAEFNTPTTIANSTILNLLNTTSDATGTLATSITNLESSFSQSNTDLQITIDANASITDTRLTTAGIGSDGLLLAGAYAGQTLLAAVGDTEVRLTTEESVSVGTHFWDGIELLKIGMKRYINSLLLPNPNITSNVQTYMGGILGWVTDFKLNSDEALDVATTAQTWAGGASSMLVNPTTGAITGWNYANGNTGQSTFGIAANSFFIENSSIPGYKPFTVDGTNVLFNGKVSFTNVTGTSNLALTDMSNVTTIDGGKITTGTIDASVVNVTNIDAGNIKTDSAWIGGWLKSSDYSWDGVTTSLPTGFGLFATGTETGAYGYNVVGGKFYGGEIIGARILLRNSAGRLAYPALTVAIATAKFGTFTYGSSQFGKIVDITLSSLVAYNDTSSVYSRLESAVSEIYPTIYSLGGINIEDIDYDGVGTVGSYNPYVREEIFTGDTLAVRSGSVNISSLFTSNTALNLPNALMTWHSTSSLTYVSALPLGSAHRSSNTMPSISGTGPITIRLIFTSDNTAPTIAPSSVSYTNTYTINGIVVIPNQAIVL